MIFISVENDDDGYIQYIGEKGTMIKFNWTTGEWRMTRGKHPNFVAKIESPYHLLALGVNTWRVENDDECRKGASNVEMSLSSCRLGGYQDIWDREAGKILWAQGEEGQFTCWDGACVPLEDRCDGKFDCRV